MAEELLAEGEPYAVPGEPAHHRAVARHGLRVVEVDEAAVERRQEDEHDDRAEDERQRGSSRTRGSRGAPPVAGSAHAVVAA